MFSENEHKAALNREIKQFGGTALSVHGHAMQEPGWPDLHISHVMCGAWWIELKMQDGKLTTLQKIRLREMNDRGDRGIVARISSNGALQLENEEGAVLATCARTGRDLVMALCALDAKDAPLEVDG